MCWCTLTLLTIAAVSGAIAAVLLVRGRKQLRERAAEFQSN